MERIIRIAFFSIVVLAIAYGVVYLIWMDKDPNAGADMGLKMSYVLIGIGALGVLVATVFNFIHHPKTAIPVLAGLVLFGILAFLGYSMSDGEVLESYLNYGVETAELSKSIDSRLFLMYGLGVIAIAVILFSEIANAAFKR